MNPYWVGSPKIRTQYKTAENVHPDLAFPGRSNLSNRIINGTLTLTLLYECMEHGLILRAPWTRNKNLNLIKILGVGVVSYGKRH